MEQTLVALGHQFIPYIADVKEIFHCEKRQEVNTRVCYNDLATGAQRATFGHFLTHQLHHFLSSYCIMSLHAVAPLSFS